MLKGFGAVPPLIRDINFSLDDRYLYVSCWGSVGFRQYEPGPRSSRSGALRQVILDIYELCARVFNRLRTREARPLGIFRNELS
ncbi:MAG TPA: selenium-binding protein SBP56-related protein [Terriglobales bacterium]|jgi:hypothetical protein